MKKIITYLCISLFILHALSAQKKEKEEEFDVFKKEVVTVKISDFLSIDRIKKNIQEKKQPISNDGDIEALLGFINANHGTNSGGKGVEKASDWLNDHYNWGSIRNGTVGSPKKNAAIVFMHHNFDVAKFKPDSSKRKIIRDSVCYLIREISALKEREKAIEKQLSGKNRLIEWDSFDKYFDPKSKSDSVEKPSSNSEPGTDQIPPSGVNPVDGTLESSQVNKPITKKNRDELRKQLLNTSLTTTEKNKILKILNNSSTLSDFYKNDSVRKALLPSINELNAAVQLNLNLYLLLEKLRSRRVEMEMELEKLKDKFQKTFSQFSETDDIKDYLLHHSDDNYLLGTKQFLIVILGGKKDIANTKVKINNKKNALARSASDLLKVATKLGTGIDANTFDEFSNFRLESSACEIKKNVNDSIEVTFLVVGSTALKPPSEVILTHESFGEKKYEIHEKVHFQLRVGVAGSSFERKDFSLDSMNVLTIAEPDSASKAEIKGNVFALLEYYPGGRDIDRFDSFFKPNSRVDLIDRFAITAGLKLSSDPLESIYTGLSFALDNGVSLTSGINFQSTPKEGEFPVGVNATLDYLRENADREYVPRFFIGLSISPGKFGELIGSN